MSSGISLASSTATGPWRSAGCADGCENAKTTGDLSRTLLERYAVTIDELPLRSDRREPDLPPCCVCGHDAVEFHHWAPRAIFPDWPDLGVYLCKTHHDAWHERMRAHGLRWPYELATST